MSAARLRLSDWTILVTNVSTEQMSVDEALVLAHYQWQIELYWKVWKQKGKVDTWQSQKAERIETEVFAKWIRVATDPMRVNSFKPPNSSGIRLMSIVTAQTPPH